MIFVRGLAIAATVLLSAALLGAADRRPPAVLVDHHVHVHSPAILAFLPAYCASPGRTSKCDPEFTSPLTVTDLLRAMDAAGIRRARVMSTAYLAESPMMVPPVPDHAEIVRKANDFTVALARAHPDRLEAYIGVNPLTATALPEIERWRGDRHVAGIKLHLANSRFDYHRPDQVRMLTETLRAAAAAHLRIMIHMRNRATGYGAEEARIFVDQVLPAARGTTVQIAHAAGWGGIDAATLDALGVFAGACEQDRTLCADLYFDLAAIKPAEASGQDKAALVALIRRIGPGHFLPASDWPFARDLGAYYAALATLPLSEIEWRTIAHNVGR
ncbi:amidohydrolase [Sphingomonas cannabina]|uniref:amidohydrolase family protein n=1 Tax=Sphingomonas cannabina TaxID=2899123 RepID=UPI001F216B5A|nr:amidohydrolase family protein [Sphingomonas cannabina]UIJ46360.1 amidohydrolase [Sphingomonas cannabina]